jgi:hypothetical protein
VAGDLELVPGPLPAAVTDPVRRPVTAWLLGYASTATRRAYAADMTAWLGFCDELGTSPLEARRVHVDAWARTAALVVSKLRSSRRQQNALAAAIKEYGALRRTVYAARYLADETYRRYIGRQMPGVSSGRDGSKRFRALCDLLIMIRLTVGWPAVASAGAVAVHVLAWPYTAVVLAAAVVYRLLAERARRKTLVDLVSHAPAGTIVVMEKGPGGPAMWLRIGDGPRFSPRAEVWRG